MNIHNSGQFSLKLNAESSSQTSFAENIQERKLLNLHVLIVSQSCFSELIIVTCGVELVRHCCIDVFTTPVEYLRWSFFAKIVNGFTIFAKKLHRRCSTGF